MIDRHRSLIHLLMSGLVGLVLGLFVAWWVWPVQWTEVPAPAAQPADLLPEEVEAASNYTAFLNWANQALLYLAAALLLVGAVVIAQQLLRQSREKEQSGQSASPPDARSSSVPAAASRRNSARKPLPSGRPNLRWPSTLNWLRRKGYDSDPADFEEPVFSGQPAPNDSPLRPPPVTRQMGSRIGSRPGSFQGSAGTPGRPSFQHDKIPEADDLNTLEPERTVASPGDSLDNDSASSDPTGPDILAEAPQELTESRSSVLKQDLDSGQDFGAAQQEAGLEQESFENGAGSGADQNQEKLDDIDESGWQAPAAETAPASAVDNFERPSLPVAEPVANQDPPRQTKRVPQTQHARNELGKFQANYALGIQSYDESFTISAADGSLLGACGMGINESLDRAAADTEQVRLLDIWLYDRAGVHSISQPLVSPGFDIEGLGKPTDSGGSVTGAPLELQHGLTFSLRSSQILLECTFNSVTFLDSEQTPQPFRSVSADLVVLSLA